MNEVVKNWGIEDRGGIELLAGDGRADYGEDARTDDGSYAERSERDGPERLLEARFGILRLGNELVDGLTTKNLRRQSPTPLVE
jgi:hypothetical protein